MQRMKTMMKTVNENEHENNMSVQYTYTPLNSMFYSKTWVYRGIPVFLVFDPKYRLYVLTCTHNLCFEQK